MATKSMGHLSVATRVNTLPTQACNMTTINGSSSACNMAQFNATPLGSITPSEYSIEAGNYLTAYFDFTAVGSRFYERIGNQSQNFQWQSSDERILALDEVLGREAIFVAESAGVAEIISNFNDGGYNDSGGAISDIIEVR